MNTDNDRSDNRSRDKDRSNVCKEDDDDGEDGHENKKFTFAERTAKRREGSRSDEIHVGPGTKERSEEEERHRVRDEGEGDHSSEEDDVVNSEVVRILSDSTCCFGNGVRASERGPIYELQPWLPLGEKLSRCF